ncbi:hypothetical protein [Dyadobacter arcticus]|uniref:Uncharacterized protein n=1 Tax=Dyadobacter arcticus TaxID=1078754 RepID=A0ABX0US25_9BACT|nr:hypothetical protein [Dyadobacter arcticus]NIJ54425.1 hypothetical protein [Dyadobacter arcticus]
MHRLFIVDINKIGSISRNDVNIGNVEIAVDELSKDAIRDLMGKWG